MVQSDGMLIMHEGLTRSGTYANFDSSNPLGGNYTNNSVIDFSKYSYITLETDAVDNEAANKFYQKNEFVLARTFETRQGRKMNEYRYSFEYIN